MCVCVCVCMCVCENLGTIAIVCKSSHNFESHAFPQ